MKKLSDLKSLRPLVRDGAPLGLKRICALFFGLYLAAALLFYGIGGDQLYHRVNVTTALSPSGGTPEITADVVLEQPFQTGSGDLISLTIEAATYDRANTGTLVLEVLENGAVLSSETVDVAGLENGKAQIVDLSSPVRDAGGRSLTLRISSPDCVSGSAVSLYYGNAVDTGRVNISAELSSAQDLLINQVPVDGQLCLTASTRQALWFGPHFWWFFAAGAILTAGYGLHLLQAEKKGKNSMGLRVISAFQRYGFLLQQLINRDFKTKYKRSILGVFWSFLNPLLTMVVQYVVFSTLFKSSIEHYPVYLLAGIVCYSYFSESTSLSLTAITGNASLITKVYIPKYIYPLARILSSGINMLLSMIPLFLVVLFSGGHLTWAVLLLPFGILCLMLFCLGMGMALSASMVFFRDTQFLWGVLTMIWMYATPIFYPESIIPARFLTLFKLNPLYHIIRFFRTVLISGVSPEPKAYLLCLLMGLVPFLLGIFIFKKTQDRFVLNL